MGIFGDIFKSIFGNSPISEKPVLEKPAMQNTLPVRHSPVPKTAEESVKLHNNFMGDLLGVKAEGNVLDGMEYSATLQLRTPLWILQKDGEIWKNGRPPEVGEPWMGIWVPHIKTWKELGFKGVKEFAESPVASDIGLVNRKKYLKFLVELRTAVDNSDNEKSKVSALKAVMRKKTFVEFVESHGGKEEIIKYFEAT